MARLFLLFTIVPLLEFFLLMRLSRIMGLGATIALVVATGAVGAMLARAEGLRVLRQWQTALAAGRVPEDGVVSGLLVLVGGVLLVTPGVLTDAVGLSLLLPPVRRGIARAISARLRRAVERGSVQVVHEGWVKGGPGFPPDRGFRTGGRSDGPGGQEPEVIDVEATVVDRRDA